MQHEVELKLELDPADVGALVEHPLLRSVQAQTKQQVSTYFDTKKRLLRRAGFSLRVRTSGGEHVQTIKLVAEGAGLFDRPEWEAEIEEPFPNAEAMADTPLSSVLPPAALKKLIPVVTSAVSRTIWILRHEDAELEVVLDAGRIQAGEREAAIHELEIEIKAGRVETVFTFARLLAADIPLRIGVLSKSERGLALADGKLAKVSKAEPVEVTASMTVADGFRAIVFECIRHFRLNEPLIVGKRDASALHQARVAMRRLRAAFSLFAPAIRDAAFMTLRDELRWFTSTLGAARDLDVLLGSSGESGSGPRVQQLTDSREEAYRMVVETLGSQRFRELMLNVLQWLETGDWKKARKASAPLPPFAGKRLSRLWGKVTERGEALKGLDEEERHRLRIDIKKLRYAVEFLEGLYDDMEPDRERFAAALVRMQESLGKLNDMATARVLLENMASEGDEAPPEQPDPSEEKRHMAKVRKEFEKLRTTGAFWN